MHTDVLNYSLPQQLPFTWIKQSNTEDKAWMQEKEVITTIFTSSHLSFDNENIRYSLKIIQKIMLKMGFVNHLLWLKGKKMIGDKYYN